MVAFVGVLFGAFEQVSLPAAVAHDPGLSVWELSLGGTSSAKDSSHPRSPRSMPVTSGMMLVAV